MSLLAWPEWLWFPPDWSLTVCMGGFVVAALAYINARPKPLKEGTTVVFSLLDTISMLVVLVWSTSLLVAPLLWLVVDWRWITIPVLVLVALIVVGLTRCPPIRDLTRAETSVVVGLPALVCIDMLVGIPEMLEGPSMYAALVCSLSVFVAFTADADQESSKFYHHDNVQNVVMGAQWLLRSASVYGLLHLAGIARRYVDDAIVILIIVDIVLFSLLIAVYVISTGEAKINVFRRER